MRFARTNNFRLMLYSSETLTAMAGVGFLHALETRLSSRILVDCGDRAGIVMGGIRQGLRHFVYREGCVARSRIESMVSQVGGVLMDRPPTRPIELDPREPVERTLTRRLSGSRDTALSPWSAE